MTMSCEAVVLVGITNDAPAETVMLPFTITLTSKRSKRAAIHREKKQQEDVFIIVTRLLAHVRLPFKMTGSLIVNATPTK